MTVGIPRRCVWCKAFRLARAVQAGDHPGMALDIRYLREERDLVFYMRKETEALGDHHFVYHVREYRLGCRCHLVRIAPGRAEH